MSSVLAILSVAVVYAILWTIQKLSNIGRPKYTPPPRRKVRRL